MVVLMRAQLSFEFLIYIVVSAASLAVMLSLFLRVQGAQSSVSARAYTEELLALVNANMAYSSSRFSGYLPTGLCNATAVNDTLTTPVGAFTLSNRLALSGNVLCAKVPGMEQFGMIKSYNGTYTLYR